MAVWYRCAIVRFDGVDPDAGENALGIQNRQGRRAFFPVLQEDQIGSDKVQLQQNGRTMAVRPR